MEEKKILDINTVNDYVDFIGAPRQHPHINVVDLSGLQSIPRSRDHYHIYGLLMLDNADSTLTHDINRSSEGGGTLMFSAPGCLTGVDNGSNVKLNGWLLLFDPTLILDTPLGRRIGDFHYLGYEHQDALRLTPSESSALLSCFNLLRRELQRPVMPDTNSEQVILDFLQLILDYSKASTTGSLSRTTRPTVSTAVCARCSTTTMSTDCNLSRVCPTCAIALESSASRPTTSAI